MDSLLLILFLFLHLFSPAADAADDLAGDASALISFRSAVGRAVLPWNTSLSPCQWKGVACSNDRVASLRLPASGLIGRIPAGTLGNLSSLRNLSLRRNALSGPLPSDLAGCAQLRLLFLNGNRFSGEIPPFLSSLHSLVRINLADNFFSGEIPLSFNNLRNLVVLYLENNRLTGVIPDLDIPTLKLFNVSFNRLNGSVPAKLRGMPANSFLNTSLCGEPLDPCPGESGGSSNLSSGAIAGIVVGAVALFLIIVVALFLLCRRKGEAGAVSLTERHDVELPEVEVGKKTGDAASEYSPGIVASRKQLVFIGSGSRAFNLEDLLRASAEVMGKGTFGTVYKAEMEMDLVVAVKRLRDVNMTEKEFVTKVEAIGAIEHPNLVPLRAYYYSKEEKLLVYDFMPNGSLFSILHGNRGHDRTNLKWETRINIALEAARSIEYIHSTSPTASHGNIKSSNILFSGSYNVQVSDHGIAHIVPRSATPKRLPEVIETQRVTQKADVFSFGVVLLELVTGKMGAEGMLNEGGVDLPRWVQSVIQEEWTGELFDAQLMRDQSPEEEMVRLLQVGLECIAQDPEHRPAMSVVVARIEEIHHLAANKLDGIQQQHQSFDDVN